jgi:hypothetical protein
MRVQVNNLPRAHSIYYSIVFAIVFLTTRVRPEYRSKGNHITIAIFIRVFYSAGPVRAKNGDDKFDFNR